MKTYKTNANPIVRVKYFEDHSNLKADDLLKITSNN
ncbi:hypothetical protein J2Z57_002586 [Formosa algae]|uniref:Uncharacterized protein n=1 Tax=Formosa algae TaxID=225843 RepID=A0A9X0YLW3_9FLAO|nr:hypothetical protein [Formosa algae]MDQ0336133.1 hypothetical protein [Formosa algae]